MEKIGKCVCIYPFEKHYITRVLEHEIERVEKEIKQMREKAESLSEKEFIRGSILSAADATERIYLRDIKTVLDRVKAMPECKGE